MLFVGGFIFFLSIFISNGMMRAKIYTYVHPNSASHEPANYKKESLKWTALFREIFALFLSHFLFRENFAFFRETD